MAQERVSKAEVDQGVGEAVCKRCQRKLGASPQKSERDVIPGKGGTGMLSTTLLQPLEVIKTHLQAAEENAQDRRFKVVVSRILGRMA